jgi:hypothetical protein
MNKIQILEIQKDILCALLTNSIVNDRDDSEYEIKKNIDVSKRYTDELLCSNEILPKADNIR